jgi:hypothetical protein
MRFFYNFRIDTKNIIARKNQNCVHACLASMAFSKSESPAILRSQDLHMGILGVFMGGYAAHKHPKPLL